MPCSECSARRRSPARQRRTGGRWCLQHCRGNKTALYPHNKSRLPTVGQADAVIVLSECRCLVHHAGTAVRGDVRVSHHPAPSMRRALWAPLYPRRRAPGWPRQQPDWRGCALHARPTQRTGPRVPHEKCPRPAPAVPAPIALLRHLPAAPEGPAPLELRIVGEERLVGAPHQLLSTHLGQDLHMGGRAGEQCAAASVRGPAGSAGRARRGGWAGQGRSQAGAAPRWCDQPLPGPARSTALQLVLRLCFLTANAALPRPAAAQPSPGPNAHPSTPPATQPLTHPPTHPPQSPWAPRRPSCRPCPSWAPPLGSPPAGSQPLCTPCRWPGPAPVRAWRGGAGQRHGTVVAEPWRRRAAGAAGAVRAAVRWGAAFCIHAPGAGCRRCLLSYPVLSRGSLLRRKSPPAKQPPPWAPPPPAATATAAVAPPSRAPGPSRPASP